MRRVPTFVRRLLGSVRLRVALLAAAAFALTLVAGSAFLLRALESRLVDNIRSADAAVLEGQAVDVLTSGLPSSTASAVPVAGTDTVAFQIRDMRGRLIVATTQGELTGVGGGVSAMVDAPPPMLFDRIISSDPTELTYATGSPIDPESAGLLGVAGQQGPFLMSTVQVYPGLSLSTASSLAEVDRTLDTTRTILWYAVPALVLLVAGLAWLMVGRALRPVHALTSRAATITARSLHERVPVSAVSDEVSELGTTINSMLDRIEASDLASRRLVSDASHELRTPITVMRTQLEVARRDSDASWTDVSGDVLVELDRLQGLVDDLLLLARMSERGTASEPFSLLDTVRDVAGRKRAVDVIVTDDTVKVADIEINGDGPAVQRALDHVVANAARHAASRVEVSVLRRDTDGPVVIHVDDDGPGIPEFDRARVLERFERLDEARSRDAGGSGLGLSVAVDVMSAHHGSVEITDSPLGGARVTLVLPVQDSPACHS